ncbi:MULTISPECIES: GntR family transcriptional regulator [unclassified Shewanella]|jgi:DNA-binding GntR family transcriptional regulator|uniref:GntR family transcriptional regulator n=1 Tax=unclassified Shewanella TaxID=196818 RepID=UPI000C32C103|nr:MULTISPECIES: GntR family transcriptional regulator [unclassified Shewanella]MBB1364707.1 GntR family transcriptional regulator [Shewanella sp. SR44-4]MBO1896630.1 GntR family transcriptional regulator [Shewanella sp. BF02_Schw]PKH29470.1 GntR family transcriptional regulator [Shewanella sp. ALD9]QHS13088.1 GntR family transcriptional regulator [Shewanella sp. Arc9-LZ]
MSNIPPIIHKTRTQLVVEALRERILSGDIQGGEPLRQSAIAEQLNVSRIPVREALVQLEAEGLINFEPHKGATATLLSVEQVTELFELRAMIESDLLAKAIPNLSDNDIAEAEAVLVKLELAFKLKESVASWSELNTRFHTRLYQAANRPHTMEVVNGLNTNCDRYIRLQLLFTGGIPIAEREHRVLLELCKKRDIAKATTLLREHILHASASITKLVEQKIKS